MHYDVRAYLEKLDLAQLIGPMDAAGRALTRVDERLKRSPELADGFRARAHFLDTCAAMWLDGELVHLEDLVLHDAGADIRAPTHELTRAAHLMRLRRRIEREPAEGVGHGSLSRRGVLALAGRRGEEALPVADSVGEAGTGSPGDEDAIGDALLSEIDAVAERAQKLAEGSVDGLKGVGHRKREGEPDLLLGDPDHYETVLLDEWHKAVGDCCELPPVLAAAFILDAWLMLDSIERRTELGRLFAAAALRKNVTPDHLPLVSVGLRHSTVR